MTDGGVGCVVVTDGGDGCDVVTDGGDGSDVVPDRGDGNDVVTDRGDGNDVVIIYSELLLDPLVVYLEVSQEPRLHAYYICPIRREAWNNGVIEKAGLPMVVMIIWTDISP